MNQFCSVYFPFWTRSDAWAGSHSRGCKNYRRVARRRTHLWTGVVINLYKRKPIPKHKLSWASCSFWCAQCVFKSTHDFFLRISCASYPSSMSCYRPWLFVISTCALSNKRTSNENCTFMPSLFLHEHSSTLINTHFPMLRLATETVRCCCRTDQQSLLRYSLALTPPPPNTYKRIRQALSNNITRAKSKGFLPEGPFRWNGRDPGQRCVCGVLN
jgi:hypothetical protein